MVFFFFYVWCSLLFCFFFFSSRRRHTRCLSDWSSDVCSSDLIVDLSYAYERSTIAPSRCAGPAARAHVAGSTVANDAVTATAVVHVLLRLRMRPPRVWAVRSRRAGASLFLGEPSDGATSGLRRAGTLTRFAMHAEAAPTGPLDGVRVLDLADESGALTGKLLGDLGADVIAIEPPGGMRARTIEP